MKNAIYQLIALSFLGMTACTAPEIGYLGDNIYSVQDTVSAPRGLFSISAAPSIDGSTKPLRWEIVDIRDRDGNPTNELLDKHEIRIWKEPFNGDTDTTLTLAEKKLKLSEESPLLLNGISGEFVFTQATKFVKNDLFNIDLAVSNIKGKKILKDYTIIELEPFLPVEFDPESDMRSRLYFGTFDDATEAHTVAISGPTDDAVPSVLDGTHPNFSVQKISGEPKSSVKVNMIIQDSYGNAVDSENIVFWPRGTTHYQNFHDNSVETIAGEKHTSFLLPAPPFPQYSRTYEGSSLMYYRSRANTFLVDQEAYEKDFGPKTDEEWEEFWNKFRDPETGQIQNFAYIRWAIKINDTGTWEIKMNIPYTKLNNQ